LNNMQERVASAGGELVVSRRSNAGGTIVSVRIPLAMETAELKDELVSSEYPG
jgi:signal transduction histidine kinase